MKTLISLFAIVVFSISANAQFIKKFPDSVAVWYDYYSWYDSDQGQVLGFGTFCDLFLMQGDTILDSVEYNSIWYIDDVDSLQYKVFYGGVREDSLNKVYLKLDTSEYLIIDFSKTEGDTGYVDLPYGRKHFVVTDTFTVSHLGQGINDFSGKKGYRLNFIDTIRRFTDFMPTWIEGVGSYNGFNYWDKTLSTKTGGEEKYLMYFALSDSIFEPYDSNLNIRCADLVSIPNIFAAKNLNKIQVYPNPASTIMYVELPATLQNDRAVIEVYDIKGGLIRLLPMPISGITEINNLDVGIYILLAKNSDGYIAISDKVIVIE